jgi:hypothetical protein
VLPCEKEPFRLQILHLSYCALCSRFCYYCLRFEVMVFRFDTMEESLVILDAHASFSIHLAFA